MDYDRKYVWKGELLYFEFPHNTVLSVCLMVIYAGFGTLIHNQQGFLIGKSLISTEILNQRLESSD